MTVRETIKMQMRAEFKQLMRFNRLSIKGLEHLESAYDALAASDYARLPMYKDDVKQVESLLKSFYGEGAVN